MSTRPTRRELLRAVIERAGRTGELTVPWSEVRDLRDEFASPDDVLLALHRRWYARFFARLDALLENPPADLPGAVEELWTAVTAEYPVHRALLDTNLDRPALARAERRQRRLLALATEEQPTRTPLGAATGWRV